MFWVIRWTDAHGEDQSVVVEASSRATAETLALKRDIPVIITDADVDHARLARRLLRCSPQRQLTCFGHPVPTPQSVCLMLCGAWTIGVLLQVAGYLKPFMPTGG